MITGFGCVYLSSGIAVEAEEPISVDDRSHLEHSIDSPLTDVDLSFVFEETDELIESLFRSEHELMIDF
jgi:hypothetical protein